MHKPDWRGLDFDGKVSEIRSSSRPTGCGRSCYAAAALLVSSVLDGLYDGTFPDFSLLALVTCRLRHCRWCFVERRFLLPCRVCVSPEEMVLRAGRTQTLDRIQGVTLWRGRPLISDFGIESVEYHAGAKYAALLERTNVSASTLDMVCEGRFTSQKGVGTVVEPYDAVTSLPRSLEHTGSHVLLENEALCS